MVMATSSETKRRYPMSAKKKAAKKAAPKAKAAQAKAPRPYIVAKCQWCGMEWKHYGDDTPAHVCGKVCAEHVRSSQELAAEAEAE